jgi:hypothetical protein
VSAVTTESVGPYRPRRRTHSARTSLDALARRKGARPVESVHDLADLEVFETDEELDKFLAHVRAERDTNLA